MAIRILIADDHAVVRQGLRTFLSLDPGIEIVGEAEDGAEAVSERETDVLRLLAQGRANKEIAHELQIAERTVKSHVSNILGKLGLQSRTQAALYAGRVGLVPVDQLGAATGIG